MEETLADVEAAMEEEEQCKPRAKASAEAAVTAAASAADEAAKEAEVLAAKASAAVEAEAAARATYKQVKALFFLINVDLTRGWRAWVERWEEILEEKEKMTRAIKRFQSREQGRGFEQWVLSAAST